MKLLFYIIMGKFSNLDNFTYVCVADLKSKIQQENVSVESYSGHLLPNDIEGAFI